MKSVIEYLFLFYNFRNVLSLNEYQRSLRAKVLDDSTSTRTFNYSIVNKIYDEHGRPKDNFGRAVALYQTYALIGSPEFDVDDDMDDSGRVYFYSLKSGKWELNRFIEDGVYGDYFGWSVALHSSLLGAVGAWRDSSNGDFSGAVYLYDLSSEANPLFNNGTKLVASNAAASAFFGFSVALGDDEDSKPQLIVGAYGSNYYGEAFIFRQDEYGVWFELERLTPPDANVGDRFGWSVDIYCSHAIVGAPLNDYNGAAYVYWYMDGEWDINQKLIQGFSASGSDDEMTYDFYGLSVATGEGVVAVGAPGNNIMGVEAGAVYLYADSNYMNQKDNSDSDSDSDYSRNRKKRILKISEQWNDNSFIKNMRIITSEITGDLVATIKSSLDSAISSATQISNTKKQTKRKLEILEDYTFLQVLAAPDAATLNRFGWSISYDDIRRRLVVGTDMTKINGIGAAYLYLYDVERYFQHEVTLVPKDDTGNILYGISVAVSGDHTIVGAARGHGVVSTTGSVYTYRAQTYMEYITQIKYSQKSVSYKSAIALGVILPLLLVALLVITWCSCQEKLSYKKLSGDLTALISGRGNNNSHDGHLELNTDDDNSTCTGNAESILKRLANYDITSTGNTSRMKYKDTGIDVSSRTDLSDNDNNNNDSDELAIDDMTPVRVPDQSHDNLSSVFPSSSSTYSIAIPSHSAAIRSATIASSNNYNNTSTTSSAIPASRFKKKVNNNRTNNSMQL